MARHRRETRLESVSDINITPLMDLTFLLLIVFMITAPMLEYGVDVSPPQLNAEPLEEERSVVIVLQEDGEIVFRDKEMDLPELRERLAFLKSERPDVVVLIRADEQRPYGEVIGIMRAVRNAGIDAVSLVTQAEEKDS